MRTIRLIGMAIMMVLIASSFTACSSDNDDEEDGGSSSSGALIKQIIGVTDSEDNCTFEYDEKGRVIRANRNTYSYSENAIFVNGRQEYVLSNGRIVKEDNYETYAYDSNGYLKEQSGDINFTFTWKDGNLIKYGDENNYFTVSYSKQKWPKGWMHYWKYTEMNEYLEPAGAWGKMPKNLPAVISEYDRDGLWRTFTFEYSFEQGHIIQLIETLTDHSDNQTDSYVYKYIY